MKRLLGYAKAGVFRALLVSAAIFVIAVSASGQESRPQESQRVETHAARVAVARPATQAPARATVQQAQVRTQAVHNRRLELSRELATTRAAELRYIDVDRAQWSAAMLGTTKLYEVLSRATTRPQSTRFALESSLAIHANLERAANERGTVYRSDLDNARLAEKQLTLAYWEDRERLYGRVDLSTRQLAYVVQDRFHGLVDAASAGSGNVVEIGRERPELLELLEAGEGHAAKLADETKDDQARKLEEFAASFDRFSNRLQAGSLDLEAAKVVEVVELAVDDLDQMVMYSMSLESPISVTVHTMLDGVDDPGHIVRFELMMDYEIDTFQNLRFDRISSPTEHSLGPFRYYLWTEKNGERSSEPQLVNFGEPLEQERIVDLVLLRESTDGS